jgi:dTMP kinase
MSRGYFVAIEGTDGSGKTALRKAIYQGLRRRGVEVLCILPQSWLNANAAEIMVGAKFFGKSYPPAELTAAYVADKESATRELVEPHLPLRHVIADRFIASDVVYHEALWGIDPTVTFGAYQRSRVRFPDCTVFVDTPPPEAFRRLIARGTGGRHRWDTPEVQEALYRAFRDAFSGRFPWPGSIIVIDNARPLPAVRADIERMVVAPLAEGRLPGS